ncbi:MAG: 4-hydroxythreonine-4-phosphate dehydrogenase PdxA [candidate division WOR-3 bacterium]|nr:MAG: 4-hydroxythreonine-4-phosphate dehydrogenase PdxA [candidate division WOR-3 bacterium]
MQIAVTMGDPSGIGPEMILRAVSKLRDPGECSIFGSRMILERTARDLRLLSNYRCIESYIVDVIGRVDFEYGRSTKRTARAAMLSIEAALGSGPDIIITAPIVKATVRMIVPGFVGHTEYLANNFGVRDYAMTGIWRDKRIMLFTAHMPLRRVLKRISADRIAKRIRFFRDGLVRYFGVDDPEIGVSAVNPHAFEFSVGEDEEIRAGIRAAARKGIRVSGPYPGDTLFGRKFDGFIAMYHDQAMVYLKSKRDGLNFTIGLPIVRLSPLCGAASDIAGKGCADASGLVAAFSAGKKIYSNMKRYQQRMTNG